MGQALSGLSSEDTLCHVVESVDFNSVVNPNTLNVIAIKMLLQMCVSISREHLTIKEEPLMKEQVKIVVGTKEVMNITNVHIKVK